MIRDNLDNEVAGLKRMLSSSSATLRFHVIWMCIVISLFGFVGGITLTDTVLKKYALLKEMNETNNLMVEKLGKIDSLTNEVMNNEEYLNFLDSYIPTDFKIQNYLTDLIFAASRAGFKVKKLDSTSAPVPRNSVVLVPLNVIFSGGTDPALLAKELENLKRVTEIEKVHEFDAREEIYIQMDIMVLAGQPQ